MAAFAASNSAGFSAAFATKSAALALSPCAYPPAPAKAKDFKMSLVSPPVAAVIPAEVRPLANAVPAAEVPPPNAAVPASAPPPKTDRPTIPAIFKASLTEVSLTSLVRISPKVMGSYR